MKQPKRSKYGSRGGESWTKSKQLFRQGRNRENKEIELAQTIINSNHKLLKYYSEVLGSLTREGPRKAVRTAIKATKEYAKQEGIEWGQQE